MAIWEEMMEKTMGRRMPPELTTALEKEHYYSASEPVSVRSLSIGCNQIHDPVDKIVDQGLKMHDQTQDNREGDGAAKHQIVELVAVSEGGEKLGVLATAETLMEEAIHGTAEVEPVPLLPAGRDSGNEPEDNCMDRNDRAKDRYKVSADRDGATKPQNATYEGDSIGVEEPDFLKAILTFSIPLSEHNPNPIMFPNSQSGDPNQQNVEIHQHCILVAASNPYPLRTPICVPQLQNLEQSETIESFPGNCLYDAEAVAKAFPQFSISLSVICPKQLPKIKAIYNAGKRNSKAADPPVLAKTPHFLILISEGFREAQGVLKVGERDQDLDPHYETVERVMLGRQREATRICSFTSNVPIWISWSAADKKKLSLTEISQKLCLTGNPLSPADPFACRTSSGDLFMHSDDTTLVTQF
ncbi:hypothetical protein JHK85_001002 [Glycine max]|nr:hypothetical protein JHK85_001002 [Glycine max]